MIKKKILKKHILEAALTEEVEAVAVRRIQRKRTKGWKMPKNAKYVGRPTKWGNPFKLVNNKVFVQTATPPIQFTVLCEGDIDMVLRLYESVVSGVMVSGEYEMRAENLSSLTYWASYFKKLDLSELKGQNLACWCNLKKPCHVDVLIKLANKT